MTGPLADWTRRSTSLGLEALEGGAFPDDSLLDHQFFCPHIGVVLCISDSAFERLFDQAGRLPRGVGEDVKGVRNAKTLDLASYLATLEC